MFVFGITLSLPGTVVGLPDAVAQFGLSLADRGTLIATMFVGLLVGSLASGPFVDRLGQRTALAVSAAALAVSFPLFALSSSLWTAGAALAAIGLAGAGINTASNALASDLFPHERGRRMNLIALVVGTGGLAMPTLTALASEFTSWRTIVFGSAVLSAAVALALFRIEPPRVPAPHHAGILAAFQHFARQPRFVWFCIVATLAGANEAATAGWTSTYLGAAGLDASAATFGLSLHWLGLVAGRLAFSGRVDRMKTAAVVRGALAGAACLAAFVLVRNASVLAVIPFATGMAIAVVMPTALALAGERYAGNAGTLFGILLTLAQVGGITLPALVGVVAEGAGIRVGMALLIANLVAIAIAAQRAAKAG